MFVLGMIWHMCTMNVQLGHIHGSIMHPSCIRNHYHQCVEFMTQECCPWCRVHKCPRLHMPQAFQHTEPVNTCLIKAIVGFQILHASTFQNYVEKSHTLTKVTLKACPQAGFSPPPPPGWPGKSSCLSTWHHVQRNPMAFAYKAIFFFKVLNSTWKKQIFKSQAETMIG